MAAVLPYTNALFNSFVHDDNFQLLQNPYIRTWAAFPKIFTTSVWSFTGVASGNYYRPMMALGYVLCYRLFGFAPAAFHLFNLVLHAAVTWIIFSITNRLLTDRRPAFAAAMIFALHPIHSESVAWIAAVTDLELTLFYLITFWLFLALESPERKWQPWRCSAMLATFGLALLSKEQALTLPLVATIYEHLYRTDSRRTTLAEKIYRYGPLWMMALGYIPARAHFLGGFAPVTKFKDMTTYELLLSAFTLIGQYLWKLLWPVHLNAFYAFQKSTSLSDGRVLVGLLGCLVSIILFCVLIRRAPLASFGILWCLIALAPVLNAQWLGNNVFTERYAYLPSVGFCWICAVGLHYLFLLPSLTRPVVRTCFACALSIVVVLCFFRIVTRNRDWRNDIIFYTKTLASTPVVPAANELRLNLAAAYYRRAEMDNAERQLKLILLTEPNNVIALNNLAAVYLDHARPIEAMELLGKVIKLAPVNPTGHLNLGVNYMRLDMFDEAEAELQVGIALGPTNSGAYYNLARLYWRRGDTARAERAFRTGLSLDRFDSTGKSRLGERDSATGSIGGGADGRPLRPPNGTGPAR